MSDTASIELTEKQRDSLFKEMSRFDLFKDSAHIPVKGISDWPPADAEKTAEPNAEKD
jgi:hypothetical protein|tara:strand:+ start:265 stop:438 length:174 start_codon:yes stop_codon:yes gene_type:complete